jgi:hypothetical protein
LIFTASPKPASFSFINFVPKSFHDTRVSQVGI